MRKEKLYQLYNDHWNSKPHKCEACGRWLGRENKTIFHDHLLEKNKYPEYEYDLKNMFLVCLDCHDQKTRGFPKPKHKEAIEKVMQHYGISSR